MFLKLFYSANIHVEKEQYFTYKWTDLISDFGGYLGLFLGSSILAIYDSFKSLFLGCTKKRVVKQKKKTRGRFGYKH
jgi:hypothetical protein